MRVVTWNLLHRIHAMNWGEPAIEAHPDEATRIAAITARISDFDGGVICLQEVSGDQLASLRVARPGDAILVHTYPRVPKPFRPGFGAPLTDPTEHLVTIVRDLEVRTSRSETFPTDQGKGFLLVELAGDLTVINTHVSYGDQSEAQCAQLVTYARPYPTVALVGDFNDDRARCGERLGPGFAAAIPGVEKPTRPRVREPLARNLGTVPSAKSEVIDHIFVSGCTATAVEVLAGGGLSDHHPIAGMLVR